MRYLVWMAPKSGVGFVDTGRLPVGSKVYDVDSNVLVVVPLPVNAVVLEVKP